MYRKIKSYLNQLFIGKVIQPINSPQTAVKFEELNLDAITQPVYVEMPIVHLRGFMELGAPMELGKGNPFVETAKILMDNPNIPDIETPLAAFYKNFQPKNAAELFGFQTNDTQLSKLKPIEASLPWISESGKSLAKTRSLHMHQQAKQYGYNLNITDGFNAYGPVSPQKLKLEVQRLRKLVQSFKAQKYDPKNASEPIQGALMVAENDAKACVVLEGNHRVSVLAAMGYAHIPVLIHAAKTAYRSRPQSWVGVKQNAYTEQEALNIFDRCIMGREGYSIPDKR